MRRELLCTEPSSPPHLSVRSVDIPRPGPGQVLVRVQATSVNPIDAKRAAGYGQRLLKLKGAGRFPLVLGNDVAGTVQAVGKGVSQFAAGQPVFGLLGTGRAGGAHASHVLVPQAQLMAAPAQADPAALAVLPYTFTTMWLALRSTGLDASNAKGARVLILGASGGLGQLAMQAVRGWGCRVTAICGRGQRRVALELGAEVAIERGPGVLEALPADFDVALNFASWEDDAMLASRLGPRALGQATTVHPLLGNFDRLGWLRGAIACRSDWAKVRAVIASRAPGARYAWTVFKPDREALAVLAEGIRDATIALPIGATAHFDNAIAAFQHVSAGLPGRAVLLP